MRDDPSLPAEETLDPADWAQIRDLSHRMVEDAVARLAGVRQSPVWRRMPDDVRASFAGPPPDEPTPLAEIYEELTKRLLPYSMGNIHPRFWMWYMGAGSYTGALAEFLAAIDGSNLGGGNIAAASMDRQVTSWLKSMMGFPESASGALVSGGTMANIIGLMVARNAAAGADVRREGVSALPRPLRFYASDQVHGCHDKAMNVLGLGEAALRKVPSDAAFRLEIGALEQAIAEDRAAGLQPACVIATSGTVNTGSIDDLPAIADFCRREGLWFHVDGCIGALMRIAPDNAHRIDGIERADSLALDPHKWLHAPFEAGCALVRDADRHRATFALSPEYLEERPRGIAAAEYLFDYGLQTSRGFRALKIWMTLKEHGVTKFGRLIDQNVAQARYLADRIESEPELELAAPVEINIVCFRFNPSNLSDEDLKALNIEIMLRLQETGVAAPSDTTVRGRHCLRVAIVNHRTRREDLDLLVTELIRIGRELTTGVLATEEDRTP